jgi:hypothetical protein
MITQHDSQSLPGMQLDGRALVRLGHRNGTSAAAATPETNYSR